MWFAALGLSAYAADLPVESLSFRVEVTGPLAEITIEQTFRNDSDGFLDGTYVFPLDADAAVDAMRMVIGERVVVGDIREREQALAAYRQAVSEGRAAALTAQERPNVFTQYVANIGPGEAVRVELHVIQPVARVQDAWELVLPLAVAPRFVPVGADDAEALETPLPEVVPTVDIDVDVHAGLTLGGVMSHTHAIDVVLDGRDATARVRDVPADQDFVLRWVTQGDEPAMSLVASGEHALLSLEPPEFHAYQARVPRELVWVVDTSCSMTGFPLLLAKRSMERALSEMDERDSFLILGFGSDVDQLSARPRDATDRARLEGRDFVRGLTTGGVTRLDLALAAALGLPVDPDRHRVVVILSDGLVSNEDELLAEVTRHPEITFVSVGIGESPNRYLLDELALLGGGTAVYPDLAAPPNAEVQRVLDAVDRPVLTEVTLDWSRCEAEQVWPSRIPDLRAGDPVTVVARLSAGCESVSVSGRIGGGRITRVVRPVPVANSRPMATTWARMQVADVHRRYVRGEIPDESALIRDIGLRYRILTAYTSFVAIENDRIVNPPPRVTVDTQSTSHGQVLTKDFLEKIPAGRSYQSVEVSAAGVVASGNPNMGGGSYAENTYVLDGVDVSLDIVETPRVEERLATNNLAFAASVGGLRSADGAALDLAGRLGGPIVRDRLWLGAAWSRRDLGLGGVHTLSDDVKLELTAAPHADHRITAAFDADPLTVDRDGTDSSTYGGALGELVWQASFSPEVRFDSFASVGRQTVQGDDRERISGGTTWRADLDGLGEHELAVGVAGDRMIYRSDAGSGTTWVAALSAADDWSIGPFTLSLGDRSARLWTANPVWAHDPALGASWESFGSHPTHVSAGFVRAHDLDRLVIGGLDPKGRPARADEGRIEGAVEPVRDLVLRVGGALRADHAPFAAAPDLTTIGAAAAAPWLDLGLARATAAIEKRYASRWEATLAYTLTRPLGDTPEALLLDPVAPWVPGFLDRSRAHALQGGLDWDLPLDPWTVTVGGFGSWASPIAGPAEAWWLRAPRTAGLRLAVEAPIREGHVTTEVTGTWAANDAAAAVLPLAVHALEPGAPSVADLAPFRLEAKVGYRF